MLFVAQLVVVEGKTDIARLRRLFNADFYATGGSAVNPQKLSDIKVFSAGRGVVLFLDNDHAGEGIRRKLQHAFPEAVNAYIIEPRGKLGQVSFASDDALLQAMSVANVRITTACTLT